MIKNSIPGKFTTYKRPIKKPDLKAFIFIAASSSKGRIDPEKDIYAIPSRSTENREIYFLALVDILTHYGMKKQAAKVAKTGLATSSINFLLHRRRFT